MTHEDRGFTYKVDETEVFVSGQPKKLFNPEGCLGYEANAYLGVTDSFCSIPEGKMFMWFPWNEGRSPIPEMYYACIKALTWWIRYQKLSKVCLFCDGGTHRSVTVFGAFLLAYCPQKAEQIVNDRIAVNLDQEADNCNPLYYIKTYLDEFPEDMLLFKSMGEDYLSRLDAHCESIYKRIKSRYGSRWDK